MSLEKIGDVKEKAGDLAGAVAADDQSEPIARALAAEAPGHPGLQNDLAITQRRLAALRAKLAAPPADEEGWGSRAEPPPAPSAPPKRSMWAWLFGRKD